MTLTLEQWSAVITIVSVIIIDIYTFRMFGKAERIANKYEGAIEEIKTFAAVEIQAAKEDMVKKVDVFTGDVMGKIEAYDSKIVETFGYVQELKEETSATLGQAREMMDPAIAVDIGEGIILKTAESLGMSNLKELGAKGRTISNAKIGMQVIGNEFAKGAGVNELIEKFAPLGEKIQQGSGLMEQFSDNPLIQFGLRFMGAGQGSTQPQVVKQRAPTGNLPRELTK